MTQASSRRDSIVGMASKSKSLADVFFEWTSLEGWLKWFEDPFCVATWLVLTCMYVALWGILGIEIPNLGVFALSWISGLAPIWLPVCLAIAAYFAWKNYVRADFLAHRKPVLLEIKIPRDIMKSPRAMEVALTSFYFTAGEVTFLVRGWKGSVRPWFSLELCSFGGEIHFYLWCWDSYRRAVETAIYAEFPEVEIMEAEDYASKFVYDPKKMRCFCGDIRYKGGTHKEDDVYPVKSYIDFELDKDPKEEFKIDPLSQWFETMSSLKPHEQAWYQINFRMMGKVGMVNPKKSNWPERVRAEVEKIRKEMTLTDEKDPTAKAFPRPTWRQQRMMETLERHLGKIPFDVGIRHIYITTEAFDGPTLTALRWNYRSLNSPDYMNQLRSVGLHNGFDFPWQNLYDIRWQLITRRHLDAMRRRAYFFTPWESKWITMSTELLATLYHFPSRTVQAPGLQRIPAKKAAPPPNLPR